MKTVFPDTFGASSFSGFNGSVHESLGETSSFFSEHDPNFDEAWASTIDGLLWIRSLENNWDGEGSEAPLPTLVDTAILLSKEYQQLLISPPDRVHASVNATIYFEWFTPGQYYEIEIVSPVEIHLRIIKTGSEQCESYRIR
jgi:hypothetical protein